MNFLRRLAIYLAHHERAFFSPVPPSSPGQLLFILIALTFLVSLDQATAIQLMTKAEYFYPR